MINFKVNVRDQAYGLDWMWVGLDLGNWTHVRLWTVLQSAATSSFSPTNCRLTFSALKQRQMKSKQWSSTVWLFEVIHQHTKDVVTVTTRLRYHYTIPSISSLPAGYELEFFFRCPTLDRFWDYSLGLYRILYHIKQLTSLKSNCKTPAWWGETITCTQLVRVLSLAR